MKLLKQKNIPWLGALMDSAFTTLPILSPLSYITMVTVLYTTSREYILQYTPWMTFGLFVGIVVLLGLILMVGVWLLILPSIWTYRNKMMNKFESELLTEIKELRKEVKELKEKRKCLQGTPNMR